MGRWVLVCRVVGRGEVDVELTGGEDDRIEGGGRGGAGVGGARGRERKKRGEGNKKERKRVVLLIHFISTRRRAWHDEEGGEGGSEGRKGKGMRWC